MIVKKKNTETHKRGAGVQDWLPFKDIEDGLVLTKSGYLLSVLRVQPININLKSETEKSRVIATVHEAFNGLQHGIQVLCLSRPIDLDVYIKRLQEVYGEQERVRARALLLDYIRYVSNMVAKGEALEKRYYILLALKDNTKQARTELRQKALELAGGLMRSGLEVHMCDDQEIIDLLYTFHNPVQAAVERAPEAGKNYNLTVYGGNENG